MFKKTVLLAGVFMMSAMQSAAAYDVTLNPFSDVAESDWFQEDVYSLSALGIIDGYEDLTYHPDGLLSREAFIKLLVTALPAAGSLTAAQGPSDVEAQRWSYPYVTAAYGRKWIDFMIDSTGAFHPVQNMTRQEVAAAVGKALLSNESAETRSRWLASDWTVQRDLHRFPDDNQIQAGLSPYVYFAVKQGVIEGDDAGLRPRDEVARKEAAAVIYRLINGQTAQRKLDVTGFYAIRSYPAMQQMSLLNNVIFGWAHLNYPSAGTAALDTGSSEYRIPSGWEEPIAAANKDNLHKELMVSYSGERLQEFVRDKSAQQAFIDSLNKVLADSRFSYDGVCIDFEGLKDAEYAANFADFISLLKTQLGQRTLTVTVPPDYYYKSYDLKKIGAAADTVILMAYDFTHDQSMLPSAPLPLVNDAVSRTLKLVPKEKLVLGISKQANEWVSGEPNSLQPEISEVEKRLADPAAVKIWRMPYFLEEILYRDARGSYDIFYENDSSIRKKLWLAKYYGLKGVSLWYMGNFTAADWGLFKEANAK